MSPYSPPMAAQGRGPLAKVLTLVPLGWLALFFLAPFVLVLRISLARVAEGLPPYTTAAVSFDNYVFLASDPLYRDALINSAGVAALSTLVCLLLGYPMAYAIARSRPAVRVPLLMLVVLPFWTSFLIRVYAWIVILKPKGLLNGLLLRLGLIEAPLPLLYNDFAVVLGIVYSYLPFMVLPLYATLVRLDPALREAAADLGCRPWRTFLSVTVPLSAPGMAAGALLVFIPALGEFVVPDLLGAPDSLMIGKVLWTEFFANRDWPLASALAAALLALVVGPLALIRRLGRVAG